MHQGMFTPAGAFCNISVCLCLCRQSTADCAVLPTYHRLCCPGEQQSLAILSNLPRQLRCMLLLQHLVLLSPYVPDVQAAALAALSHESLLQDRNRKLNADVTKLRNAVSEHESQASKLQQDLQQQRVQSETQTALIAKLEVDLLKRCGHLFRQHVAKQCVPIARAMCSSKHCYVAC